MTRPLWILTLLALACLPACGVFSYGLSHVENDSPVEPAVASEFTVGSSRLAEVVTRLGPPDRVSFFWPHGSRRVIRFEYAFGKRRFSDMTFHIPRQEVSTYNSGVRFFLLYLDALRGKSLIPDEVQLQKLPTTASRVGVRAASNHRLSRYRALGGSLDGGERRLSRLQATTMAESPGRRGPVSRLDALVLQGKATGFDVVRLEFNDRGVLINREIRLGTPRTDLKGQLLESVLQ